MKLSRLLIFLIIKIVFNGHHNIILLNYSRRIYMNKIGLLNLLSLIVGIALIVSGCVTAYLFQKHLFNKYKNEVKNTINKDTSSNQ
ncbi:hypothetical protein bsdtw1_02233 [Clostridium fungisolvens]|uniref:Uncharacterized protein n=2 Tax=Clostridium fungisolvens TaxID=1604897 RepID=A0A6V8SHD5_9CLOT|nr:hypothetical protein bsdtw1_02233 [Clostridium fungisolvens]